MKNLKKILAVVLVVAMAFSFAAVAGAAYTDDADINFDTAVGVMTGIGAINGYPDGSFNPDGLVTRAEAAKLICYAILGPTVAGALPTATSTFSDVANSYWAVKYIQYCVNAGIINGRGDGTFDPAGNVTGIELAKMMLCAAGYGKAGEYVGANWAFNVLVDAMAKNIFAGNDTDYSAAATREAAALYIYNSLINVGKVTYNTVLGYSTPGATIGAALYQFATATGTLSANQATGATYTVVGGTNYTTTTGLGLVGHNVTVFYKNGDATKVYYVQDNSTTFTATATTTALPTGVTFPAAVTNYTNYAANGTLAAGTIKTAGTYIITNNVVTGYVEPATFSVSYVKAITTTSGAQSITINGAADANVVLANNATSDVVKEYTGIAVGDYVIVAQTGTIVTLTKAATIEGTISKIAGTTVTLGGTAYTATTATADYSKITDDAANFTGTFVLYLDGQGGYFAIAAKSAAVDSGLFYPTLKYTVAVAATKDAYGVEVTPARTDYFVQGVNMQGAMVIYQTTAVEYATITVKTLYTVATTYNSTDKLTYADMTAAGTALPGTDIAATAVKLAANQYYSSDVKAIYVDGSGSSLVTKVVSGPVAIAAADTGYYYSTQVGTTSNYLVKYVILDKAYPTTATGAGVIYVADATLDAQTALGDVYNVYLDGAAKEITVTAGSVLTVGFYDYTVSSTGVTTLSATAAVTKAATAITNNYNGLITTATATDINVNSALIVNISTNTAVVATAAGLATTDTVAMVLNAAGTAATVVYVTASSAT